MRKKLLVALCLLTSFLGSVSAKKSKVEGPEQRKFLVETMLKIADPVLNALSQNQLKAKMPVEAVAGEEAGRRQVTYLEAFARLIGGMSPWLELGPDKTAEGKLREKYILLARKCIQNAVDTSSADFMNFTEGRQPVVDASFFAQALLRAPNQLWEPLDTATKANIIHLLKATRAIKPHYNNWLLFSAMIETAIFKFSTGADFMRIDYAIKSHENWYLGDGTYGDGPNFHFDYYNSFVIQPMLLDVSRIALADESVYKKILIRAKRQAEIQERLISPEGTYPPVGRSLTYRFGAFQLLSQIALQKDLPDEITPEQVRCALYAVVKNQISAPGTFDQQDWLTIGFYGHQPELGESYISTGSLYLCSQVFLCLGLPPSDSFWTNPNKDWTQKRIWSGKPIKIDHAIK